MGNGIYVALSGAVAQSTALDVAANNVANANTNGYRAERLRFSQALARARDTAFVRAAGGASDNAPGVVTPTGNPLDAAIGGDGYFTVDTARGVRFTRDGAFRIDAQRRLVTADGNPVRGANGKPLVIPPDASDVQLGADGVLRAGDQELGKLQLVRFAPGALQREGASLYVAPANAKPLAGAAPELQAGALEGANVSVVRGVVDLVRISRAYEALHKMIESYKDIDDRAARGIGGSG
jgi:flagellar basal-body rod protein FlgF